MGQSLIKQFSFDKSQKNKQNNVSIIKFTKQQYNPSFRANFNYFQPLSIQIEENPDQQASQFGQNLSINSYRSGILSNKDSNVGLNTQTNFSLSQMEEIKVNWNSFIKMKNKNYLQDYEVIKKIGRGGFGTVNKVKNIHTQVLRAAKVIKKSDLKEEDHKKLLEELAIMRNLDHPNIIKLYEVYDFEKEYVLILQLSGGGQLYKRIKGKKLNEKMAKIYMRQIIRTLVYLHSQGIVHRDLKPQNMLLEQQESNILKIIDFGIAARIKEDQFLSDRIGTPFYIAPEVIYKKYNEKCDIWSAGVIFYMMLTGTTLFKAQNQVDLLQCILRQEPKFPSSFEEKYSEECKSLLKLMLIKKSQKRPSASELINHSWFSIDVEEQSLMQKQQGAQILKNIRKFNFSNKLQAVVNTFIASQLLTNQEKNVLVNLFRELDKDNNGVISSDQLKQALEKQKKISFQRVQLLTNVIDTNCNGQIDYTEFLVASLSTQNFMKRQYFEKAFAYFDIDNNGTITYGQVVEFLQSYQESEQEIQKMFKQVDSNGDGEIDQEQFIKLFLDNSQNLKLKLSKKQIVSSKDIDIKRSNSNSLLEKQNLNQLQLNFLKDSKK